MGPRTARLSQGRPRHRPRFRRLLHVDPARFLLGALVSLGLATLFLAVPVVSGKVTDPPPAALLTPAPGAQSTAGSVVVMGEDGAPVLGGVPGATRTPSAAPTSTAATSTAASHAATTAASRRPSAPTPLAAGAPGRPVARHSGSGTPATTGAASSSSRPSAGPTGAPGTGTGDPSATGSSAPPVLPTDTPPVTVTLPVTPPALPSTPDPPGP
jgi:hypothetical protein